MPETVNTSASSEFFLYCIDGELTTPLTQISSNSGEQMKTNLVYTNSANKKRVGFLSANYLLEV